MKVSSGNEYKIGRFLEGQRVLGGIERGSGGVFLLPVLNSGREMLTRTLEKVIVPGVTIITDCWRAYVKLGDKGYHHLTVNHSINFVTS